MSDIWIPYGGGADLDVITATASDVRKGKVIVDKDGNPLTGIMAEIDAKTYTPGTSNQVIAANQFLAGAQTIKGDGNLNANNIVYGKSIFGVAGKVRKYARIEGSKSTSGSKTFYIWNRSNVSVYWPYLDIPTGFTPLLGWFRSGVGSDPPFNGNTAYEFNNQYCISYNAVHGLVNTSTGGAEANNTRMIVPVPNSGSYIYNIVGYY